MHNTLRKRFLNSCSENLKSKIQNRKWVGIVAAVIAFAMCGAVAQAQQPTKVPRIGYLTASSLSANPTRVAAFRQVLRELGYIEGKTSSLSGDLQRGKGIASLRSRPS